ncbi:MAG: lactate oxidase [Aerococcus sp.]|nr:lactate oxidase [Aerococcus sp.]
MATNYQAPNTEGGVNFINLFDLEAQAKAVIPSGGFGYISGAAGDLWTLRENIKSFDHKLIPSRVLQNIENPDPSTEIFGRKLDIPMVMAPIASHKLAHERGELTTSKGTANSGTAFTISSYSSYDTDDVREAMGPDAPLWFQFYMGKDNNINKDIIDHVKEAGTEVIVLTADATVGGNREEDKRTGFTYPFGKPLVEQYSSGDNMTVDEIYHTSKQKLSPEDVQFIAEYSGLPVFVKGVQTKEDAELSIQAGAKGIWVSNHGARQIDAGMPAFYSLFEVAEAVDHRVPIIFDSGIRRGTHIFKALAAGADLVAIGRPVLYGAATGGVRGVEQVYEFLKDELLQVMQLAGTPTIEDVKKAKLYDYPWGN